MADSSPLLNQAFIDRLRRLIWLLPRLKAEGGDCGRSTPRTGGCHAFRGYRPYTPGDEPRNVDWNVLGRTDQLVVKVFGREEDLTVDVLVDATDSMWCGDPSKTGTARQLAAAFGYIALNSKHRLRLGVVSGGCLSLRGAYVGMESAAGYFRDLESMEAGRADAAGGLGAYLDRIRRPGAVIFLSDCLENDALTRALARLGDVAAEATLIQVLSPQDLHPAFNGAVLLSDAEESGVLALKADPSLRKKYGLRLEAYRQDLQRLCQRHTLAFHSVSSGDPLEGIVMTWFQARKAR